MRREKPQAIPDDITPRPPCMLGLFTRRQAATKKQGETTHYCLAVSLLAAPISNMHPAEIQPLLLPRSFGPTTLFLAPVGLRFRARHAKGRDVKPTVCLLEGVDLCLLLERANIPGPASRHHKGRTLV
ncbi:unnamed protein product [Ectocarpus fasciculatus]